MGQLIEIKREEDKPRLKCPHCKRTILIDIRPWEKDATKIMSDRCPQCHGEIVVGLLIMAHKNMPLFLGALKAVIDFVNSQNQILGPGRK